MTDLPDLDTPDQIEKLVRTFYIRVEYDDLLGPVFVDQARVDWGTHMDKLTAFWCQMELGIPGFHGDPTARHGALSIVEPFRAEQFERWVWLFHDTVDSGWRGPHADSIKQRALTIAQLQSRVVPRAEVWGDAPSQLSG